MRRLAAASDQFEIEPTDPQDMALMHFTSGTTGPPKGAVHVHEAVVAHLATGVTALDLHPDDVFWCTADPGWVTGTSYGIIAPLTHGVTSIVDEGEFDAERWYRILESERVSVWYTGPDRSADAHALRRRPAPPLRPQRAAVRRPASASRSTLRRSSGAAARSAGASPRHLVADRDRRDHDRQLRGNGHPPRFDGPAVARGRGHHPRPRARRAGAGARRANVTVVDHAGSTRASWRSGPGWPSMFRAYLHDPAALRRLLCGRLVSHR